MKHNSRSNKNGPGGYSLLPKSLLMKWLEELNSERFKIQLYLWSTAVGTERVFKNHLTKSDIILYPGQLFTSLRGLARKTGTTNSTVERFLRWGVDQEPKYFDIMRLDGQYLITVLAHTFFQNPKVYAKLQVGQLKPLDAYAVKPSSEPAGASKRDTKRASKRDTLNLFEAKGSVGSGASDRDTLGATNRDSKNESIQSIDSKDKNTFLRLIPSAKKAKKQFLEIKERLESGITLTEKERAIYHSFKMTEKYSGDQQMTANDKSKQPEMETVDLDNNNLDEDDITSTVF